MPPIQSKLPQVGTTIFTVMSSLANEYKAINLGQGFPDYPMNAELVELVNKAMKDGYNQYTHMCGLPALRERTGLFNAIMYGHGGASRAERELATVATSRVNGCLYCASVHARRYAQLTKDTALVQRLLDEGTGAAFDARTRALVDYAVALTRDPASLAVDDLAPLRAAGFGEGEILDLTLATAMFAWANRLMQTIGESVPPGS